jgi:hypothetical protein
VSVAIIATSTEAPVVTAAPVAVTAAPVVPDVPASLSAISPLKLRRGETRLLDLRGQALRADHKLSFTKAKGNSDPSHVRVTQQKLVDPTLMRVLVVVAPNAATGAYTTAVTDSAGRMSNALTFEIAQ